MVGLDICRIQVGRVLRDNSSEEPQTKHRRSEDGKFRSCHNSYRTYEASVYRMTGINAQRRAPMTPSNRRNEIGNMSQPL